MIYVNIYNSRSMYEFQKKCVSTKMCESGNITWMNKFWYYDLRIVCET